MVVGENLVNVGTLQKLEWKVSVGMSSSNCKNLDAPIVTLLFTLKDSTGKDVKNSMELNLKEFQVNLFLQMLIIYN